jgi:23S rRNA (cytidine1920-2'-O)/16S rRNA (cytidine1409-2'-O)-methyltransferase
LLKVTAMRADLIMVQRGMVPTRSAAQRLISGKGLRWMSPRGWVVLSKAGEDLPEDATLEVINDAELRFVSRGGLKLEGALARLGITAEGKTCLDVGQSTGGFTDFMLGQGAVKVVGLDVGHGQLNPKLAADPRVQSYEGVNARDVADTAFAAEQTEGSFDLIVADVSFISLTHVLPTLFRYLAPEGDLVVLVKPQFELQPPQIGKGGIVKNPALFNEVETRVRQCCRDFPMKVHDYFRSPVTGGNGNTEFFMWVRHPVAGLDKARSKTRPPEAAPEA